MLALVVGLGTLTACGTSASDEQLEAARTWFAEEAPHVASVERLDQDRWDFSHGSDQPVRVEVTLDEGSGPAEVAELAEAQGKHFAEDGDDGIAVLITTVRAGDVTADLDLDRAHNDAVVALLEQAERLGATPAVSCTGNEECAPAVALLTVEEPGQIADVALSVSQELGDGELEVTVTDGESRVVGPVDVQAADNARALAAEPLVTQWQVSAVPASGSDGPATTVTVVRPAFLVQVRERVVGLDDDDLVLRSGPVTVTGRGDLPDLTRVLARTRGLPIEAIELSDAAESAGAVRLRDPRDLERVLGVDIDATGAGRPSGVVGEDLSVVGTVAERTRVGALVRAVLSAGASIGVEGDRVTVQLDDARPATVTPLVEAVRAVDVDGTLRWRVRAYGGAPLDVSFTGGTDGAATAATHSGATGSSEPTQVDRAFLDKWDRTP